MWVHVAKTTCFQARKPELLWLNTQPFYLGNQIVMNATNAKILVLGATGTIGSHLVRNLVDHQESVKAASRQGTSVPGAEAVSLDLTNPATFVPALSGVNRVFAMVPSGNVDPVGLLKPFLEETTKRGIKVVLLTVMGADADERIPYRQLELFLEKQDAPYVFLRPNWFSDNFQSYWLNDIRQGLLAVPAADGKSSFVDARDIAASASAALRSSAFDKRAFTLTGPQAHSYAEAAAILARVIDKPITYTPLDDASFIQRMVGAGVPEEYAQFLAAIFEPVRQGWTAQVTQDVFHLTGKQPRSLESYAMDRKAILRS
jgi:uncharacterized protein YbjT (DUF2867 family)